LSSRPNLVKVSEILSQNKNKQKRTGDIDQVVECLSEKSWYQSPVTHREKERERERERERENKVDLDIQTRRDLQVILLHNKY
jgi:hypothetical protein